MITRRLEDGWDYQVNWRLLIAEQRLREKPDASVLELCADEEDLVVRQYLRFRKTGSCAAALAIRWAESCYAGRSKHVAAAILQAMTIAGSSREQIASRLCTAPINVTFFQKLYFDVGRYLHMREWIASIATPSNMVNPSDPVALKTRIFLAAAYHYGQQGLDRVMTTSVPKMEGEVEQLTAEIRKILALRAHEAMLRSTFTPAGPEDMARFIEFSRLPAASDLSKRQEKWDDWVDDLKQLVLRKKETCAETSQAQLQLTGAVDASRGVNQLEPFSRS